MDVGDVDEVNNVEERKCVRISLHLIAQRHLPAESNKWPHDKIVEALNKISHLRLDREHITHIDNLELLGHKVTNLYLQHNCIRTIENLESLPNLQFLTLAYNRLRRVQGISRLQRLAFLDLSNNLIELIDIDELPQSLIILNFEGNPCTYLPDYRGRIIQDLAKLRQLDGEEVTRQERREVGYAVSSSSEEEEDNDEEDDSKGNLGNVDSSDVFKLAASDILLRSQDRMEGLLKEHKKKMNGLVDFRTKHSLPAPVLSVSRSMSSGQNLRQKIHSRSSKNTSSPS